MERPTTDHHDQPTTTNQPADQPATDHEPCSIDEAAERLGITPNAVRQRLKRGTLHGSKTDEGWIVWMTPTTPTDQATSADHGQRPTDRPATWSRPTTNQPPTTVDLQPFADLIERLTMQAATAGYWQARALHAEDRLAALEAGDRPTASAEGETAAPVQPPPEPEEAPTPTAITLGVAWRQWFRRIMGRA